MNRIQNRVSLKGATITFPVNWQIPAGYGRYVMNCKLEINGNIYDYSQIEFGYSILFPNVTTPTQNSIVIIDDFTRITNSSSFKIYDIKGSDVDNYSLIRLFERHAEVEGGIIEAETTDIIYKDEIKKIYKGENAVVKCRNRNMEDDIIIKNKSLIYYKDITQEINANENALIECDDSKMSDNIKIVKYANYSYNGHILPSIPDILYKHSPYMIIVYDNENENNDYFLLASEHDFYIKDNVINSIIYYEHEPYMVASDNNRRWGPYPFRSVNGYEFNENKQLIWSNFDVKNDDNNDAEIIFTGTKPIPVN